MATGAAVTELVDASQANQRRRRSMLDPSRSRSRRRHAASAAIAALALGLAAAGCSSTTETSGTTGTTAKPGTTGKPAPAASADLPGIPTFKVMVKEESGAAAGGSTTTAKAGGASTTSSTAAGSATTTTEADATTTTAKSSGTTMPSHSVRGLELAAQDPGHDNNSSTTPGTAGTGGGHGGDAMARYTFDTEDTMPTGLVMIDLVNNGQLDHQVNFFRPKKADDMAKIDTILASPTPELALALVEFVGGSNAVVAGGEQKTVSKFEAGTYYLGCFITDADGVPHIGHGMVKKVVAKAASGSGTTAGSTPSGSAAPAAVSTEQAETMKKVTVGEIKMKDFNIALPDGFNGKGWYEVTNDEGLQPHETTIVKLQDGKTKDDVVAWASEQVPSGPPPFTSAGGFGGLDPKATGWVYLDLAPGKYLALCFIPNSVPDKSAPPGPPDLKPHLVHGMVTEFSIK
jgi:hypothetical protein